MTAYTISPLDGRYSDRLYQLSEYFSDFALTRERYRVELLYLIALSESGRFGCFSEQEIGRINHLITIFSFGIYERIKQIEETTKHDIKAIEVFLSECLGGNKTWLTHFCLTSEDVNNLAYGCLLSRYVSLIQIPLLGGLIERLKVMVDQYASIPFPTHTHGQLASPSTVGKELAVFLSRLVRQYETLRCFGFNGKLNGATGTFASWMVVDPDYDWIEFSRDFVDSLGLRYNLITTQINDGDNLSEYFSIVQRIGTIIQDLDVDMWEYISRGYFVQRVVDGEVGSSTMANKINPINFENSEGNIVLGNALLVCMEQRLGCSRMQRDLSDSTIKRNIGVALGHIHLAILETIKGLERVEVDVEKCRGEIVSNQSLLAEPYQLILKAAGINGAYDLMKGLTRGKNVTRAELDEFIELNIKDEAVKQKLKAINIVDYIGACEKICKRMLNGN